MVSLGWYRAAPREMMLRRISLWWVLDIVLNVSADDHVSAADLHE